MEPADPHLRLHEALDQFRIHQVVSCFPLLVGDSDLIEIDAVELLRQVEEGGITLSAHPPDDLRDRALHPVEV